MRLEFHPEAELEFIEAAAHLNVGYLVSVNASGRKCSALLNYFFDIPRSGHLLTLICASLC
jgi:hypothetical protein